MNRVQFTTELNDQDLQSLDLAWLNTPAPLADGTFDRLFKEFLGGHGIPCPALFDSDFRGLVNSIVPLEDADHPSFRVRSFLWAVGGVPFVVASNLAPAIVSYS